MDHTVQFYENDESLYSVVGDYLADGLAAGERVVVVATPEHRAGFSAVLQAKGVSDENLIACDARETLATFMDGCVPNTERFHRTVGELLAKSAATRAYGEMVDLLWNDGNADAALRLEDLWNELLAKRGFSLLCAYSFQKFCDDAATRGFEQICDRHQHALPALREALTARRRSERELQDFVDNAPIGMHWVGPDGTILWANEAELKLLGYAREEYVGRNIAEFHADQHVLRDILGRLTRNEGIHDYEARLVAKDGSIRHVAIDSNSLFDNERFMHTRCFTRDITARKRLEDGNAFLLDASVALFRSLDYETRLREIVNLSVPRLADACAVDVLNDGGTFARVVAEPASFDPAEVRTAEPCFTGRQMIVPMKIGERMLGVITLAATNRAPYDETDFSIATELANRAAIAVDNAHLYQLAQSANRTKDEFLATLSHELRTPLTAILGWARMMLMGGFDAETTRTALETIERSARTQTALIDDLLDLSKIVTGKLALEKNLVDLSSVVDNAVSTTQLAADARSIQLDVRGVGERAVVVGDPTRLQQIVWNLLSNAIKFSEPGSAVALTLERRGGYAQIVVRDRGKGISREFLPHVFEAFRQADGTNTRQHNGLGLGLAIVKYLCELHGGSVSAASAGEGEGATFTVTLPLVARRSAQVHGISPDEFVDLHGLSILLVDDDADTREVMTAILRRCGATVEAASSVHSACGVLDARMPDILITDIAMPGKDGYDLLHYLQAHNGSSAGVRVVALTAFGHPTAEAELRAAGFDAYVRKPVDPLHFARVIAALPQPA